MNANSEEVKRSWFSWTRVRQTALILFTTLLLFLVFISGRFFYMSHDRFGSIALMQRRHQRSLVESKPPQTIGHRGCALISTDPAAVGKDRLIGNTRNAIRKAIDAGIDWIEIDVRKSKGTPGELVLFHDTTIAAKTTCNDEYKIEDLAIEQLQSYDLHVEGPEKILTLKEAFEEFHAPSRNWILDIKTPGIRRQVVSQLGESRISADQIIIFGDQRIVAEYKDAGYRLGFTALFKTHRHLILTTNTLVDRCKNDDVDLLVVPIVFVTPSLVDYARKNEIEVWSYDSNSPDDWCYCSNCGVGGIIVDFPGQFQASMAKKENQSAINQLT